MPVAPAGPHDRTGRACGPARASRDLRPSAENRSGSTPATPVGRHMTAPSSAGGSLSGWLGQFVEDLRRGGGPWRATYRGVYYAYLGLWHTLTSRVPVGTNVFEREWDVLVLLDSCRVDAMRAVSDEYEFVEPVGSIWSVGSTSHEWVAKTFTRAHAEEISRTAYVTANGYLYRTATGGAYPPSGGTAPFCRPRWDVVDLEDLCLDDQVWEYGRDGEFPIVPPTVVTDRAIATARASGCERLVVHYMQPHGPYIAEAFDGRELRPSAADHLEHFRVMGRGESGRERAWEGFLENLRFVLDEVELLRSNVDADRVAITADHGHMLGELGQWTHPDGCPLPVVKKVPWVVTDATDTGSYAPRTDREEIEASVEDYLRDLGYVV